MNTAPVKWAQRKDSLYVTISLPDVKDHKVDLTNDKLTFHGTSNGKEYNLNMEFVSPACLLFCN
jgi:prostaglandin-E synthase